jgi:CBS domain-containing protein
MNILMLMTPKHEVAFIYDDFTVRQALEKMEHSRYTAIPILGRNGGYVGTLTEGDLLWEINNKYMLNLKEAEKIPVSSVPRIRDNLPVRIDTRIEDLISKAINQNFAPVLDDRDLFIGIVTRKDIIHYCYEKINEKEA